MLQKLKGQRRSHDSGSDSEESDSDDLQPRIKFEFKRVKLFIILKSVLFLEGQDVLLQNYFRAGNKKRDRIGILRWAAELDDKMFQRQFRLYREDFFYVLLKITGDLSRNEQQGTAPALLLRLS